MSEAVTKAVTTCDKNQVAEFQQMIVERLEHAGKTLLALPNSGYSPRLKQKRYDVVRSFWEAYSGDAPAMRVPVPTSSDIALMDEAIAWLDFIPAQCQAMRNTVRARMMVHPVSNKYLYGWRRIAVELHMDHKSVMRLHGMGIKKIILGIAQTPQTTL